MVMIMNNCVMDNSDFFVKAYIRSTELYFYLAHGHHSKAGAIPVKHGIE